MKYFAIFALFLLFACCEETNRPVQCVCVEQFSDALPIQFWPEDCNTYNETDPDGVHYKCFCHPWKCTDEIKLQFTGGDIDSYDLVAINEEGDEIFRSQFTQHEKSVDFEQLPNGLFVGSLSPWTTGTTHGGGTVAFSWAAGDAAVTLTFAQVSMDLLVSFPLTANHSYTFRLNGSSDFGSQVLTLAARNSITGYQVIDSETLSGFWTRDMFLTPTENCDQVYITVRQISVGSVEFHVEDIQITEETYIEFQSASIIPQDHGICEEKIYLQIVTSGSPEEVIGKTDCLDVSDTSPDPTVLINYSNNRNFAGLIFEHVSPEQEFNIRVPAVFFHERFPEEDEAIELSDSRIINLNGVVRAQRLLDTGYMPYYMHRKLKLIFKHSNVSIDGLAVTKQDAYEIEEGDRRWPLKKAKCWLTEKDFVQRNVV